MHIQELLMKGLTLDPATVQTLFEEAQTDPDMYVELLQCCAVELLRCGAVEQLRC